MVGGPDVFFLFVGPFSIWLAGALLYMTRLRRQIASEAPLRSAVAFGGGAFEPPFLIGSLCACVVDATRV